MDRYALHTPNKFEFVDWCPTGVKYYVNQKGPPEDPNGDIATLP